MPLYILVKIGCIYIFTLLFETVSETKKQKKQNKGI